MYSQVVIIRRKTEVEEAHNNSKKKCKYYFQGKSERSQRWFDIDLDWLKYNFMTMEPEFYKHMFQCKIEGQSVIEILKFPVPIGNEK